MEEKNTKTSVKVDNSAYNDRFRFVLTVNDNIICERFFKINNFSYDAINSEAMKSLFVGEGDLQYGTVVSMIMNDLKSKSRVYTWYTTETPVKLTGFGGNKECEYLVYPEKGTFDMQAKDGEVIEENENEPEQVEPFDVTFKFSFQMANKITQNDGAGKPLFSDYKPVYEAIWDGSVFPKFVRNSVDLTNSYGFKDKDVSMMNFIQSLNYRMTCDKKDLVYQIIKEICNAATDNVEDEYEELDIRKSKPSVIHYLNYGGKKYPMSNFNKEYIDGWRKATEQKTKDYYKGRI